MRRSKFFADHARNTFPSNGSRCVNVLSQLQCCSNDLVVLPRLRDEPPVENQSRICRQSDGDARLSGGWYDDPTCPSGEIVFVSHVLAYPSYCLRSDGVAFRCEVEQVLHGQDLGAPVNML